MRELCKFCQIIKGLESARIVYRDERTMAFFPKEMNVKGHTIILPTEHFEDIFSISDDRLENLLVTTRRLAIEFKQRLGVTGINILHASGRSAQQSVFHFHIHLLPRFENDGMDAWPNLPKWHGDLDELENVLKIENTNKILIEDEFK